MQLDCSNGEINKKSKRRNSGVLKSATYKALQQFKAFSDVLHVSSNL